MAAERRLLSTQAMGLLMLSIGLIAALLGVAAWLQGWWIDASLNPVRIHVLLALPATLLLALSQCWTAVFLLGAWRALRTGGVPRANTPWRAVTGSMLAVSLMVVSFVVGFRMYSGEASAVLHMILGTGAVVWSLWSLAISRQGLKAVEAELAAREAPQAVSGGSSTTSPPQVPTPSTQ